jgi:hypothetical protein
MIGKKLKECPTLKIQQNLLNLQKTTFLNEIANTVAWN